MKRVEANSNIYSVYVFFFHFGQSRIEDHLAEIKFISPKKSIRARQNKIDYEKLNFLVVSIPYAKAVLHSA